MSSPSRLTSYQWRWNLGLLDQLMGLKESDSDRQELRDTKLNLKLNIKDKLLSLPSNQSADFKNKTMRHSQILNNTKIKEDNKSKQAC